MYHVTFVYDDSSTFRFIVEATSEKQALNCILTNTRDTRQPKFVVFEKPTYVAKDTDYSVVEDLESWGGEYENVYRFKNKLNENVTIGGITVKLGSLLDIQDYL